MIVLDDPGFDAGISAIHEAQHAFDQLEYTQYGMRSLGVRVGRDAAQTTQTELALTSIQGWELEFTAYARTMVEVGRRIEAEPRTTMHRASDLMDGVFGAKYLQHYLAYENNPEEHARGTRELLDRFIFQALRRTGYRSRDWNFATMELEDMQLMVPDVLMQHLNIVKNTVSGAVIRESAQQVLDEFYMAKLGYVPNYPDITALTSVTVSPPTEPSAVAVTNPSRHMPPPLAPNEVIRLVSPSQTGQHRVELRFTSPIQIAVDGRNYRLRESSQKGILTLEDYSITPAVANRVSEQTNHPIGTGARLNYTHLGDGYAVTIEDVGSAVGVFIKQTSGLEEPTAMPVTPWQTDRFSVSVGQGVILQRPAGQVTEKVGYLFRPSEAGLAVLFAGFHNPDADPAVYYALVDHVEQAQALIQAGVVPVRIVALAKDGAEVARFRQLTIPGDNILVGHTIEQAVETVRDWIRVLHGATVRVPDGTAWATEAQLLLAQLTQWLDGQGWVPAAPLTAGVAETITRINQMA